MCTVDDRGGGASDHTAMAMESFVHIAGRVKHQRHLSIWVAFILSGCMIGEEGPAPDLGTDDPEWEDESEAELGADDTAENGMIVPIHAVGVQMRVCGATSLNQRSGPGTTFAVLRALPEDTVVMILDESGSWLQNNANGDVGWSHKNYLCAVEPMTPPPMTPPTMTPPTLPPATSASASVRSPSAGSQRNAVRIVEHDGYVIANTGRDGYYGTAETMFWLRRAFDVLAIERPQSARPQIRDISVRAGGRPSGSWPHSSHQSGRDVDITYPRASCDPTTGCLLGDVSPTTYDATATWILFETWLVNKAARRIFVDSSLHASLKAQARARGHSEAKIQQWFGPVIQHVANHLNHFHVRFNCPADDGECIP